MNWQNIFLLLVGAFVVWMTVRNIRNQPEAFSKENTNKSVKTLGVLALLLIAFVAILIITIRH